jgi:dUTP pyrophosphatase
MKPIAYQTELSAGFDLSAKLEGGGIILNPGERVLVPTGLKVVDILDREEDAWGTYLPYIMIVSRSGLTYSSGLIVLNAPGIVDLDYPGEIGVILFNAGASPILIEDGDHIAQAIIGHTRRPDTIGVKLVAREGGFGSTGVK